MTRVRVYESTNSAEAHLALAALLAAGIDARAEANHLSGIDGAVGIAARSVYVWVAEDQLPLARQVLADFERDGAQTAPKGSSWACQTCGEVNGPAFEACWKCSTAKES